MSAARHGTRTSYDKGCRCVECCEAKALYERLYRAGVRQPPRNRQKLAAADVDWMDQAACSERGPDLWFEETFTTAAMSVCVECPVRDDCLEYAVDTDQKYGIWGGLTEAEREKVVAARTRLRRAS